MEVQNQTPKTPVEKSNTIPPIPRQYIVLGVVLFITGILVGFILNIIFLGASIPSSHLPIFLSETPTPQEDQLVEPTTVEVSISPESTQANQAPPKIDPRTAKAPIFISPAHGATLCIGKSYIITWVVGADIGNVALNLYPPAGLPFDIINATDVGTTLPNGNIEGSYTWTAGQTIGGNNLESGPGYRLGLRMYSNASNGAETFIWGNFFSLDHCNN